MSTSQRTLAKVQTSRARSDSSSNRLKSAAQGQVIRRALADPHTITRHDVPVLQRALGNQATMQLLRPVLQAKLTLGPAGDRYEQEADQVADQVVRSMNNAPENEAAQGVQREEASFGPIQRMPEEEEELQAKRIQRVEEEEELQAKRIQRVEEEEEMVQGKQMHGPEGGEVDESVQQSIQAARGGGRPLDDGVRTSMEQGFGADFSNVRVHTGPQADALNRSLNAKAFTTGGDIFFGQGQYQPESTSGQKLLAHELTHTVQQGAASTSVSRKITFDVAMPSRTGQVQRVMSANKFKKKTSLSMRKGKSHNFFTQITQDLRTYHGMQLLSPDAKLLHIEGMLDQIDTWLNTRDAAKTSRRPKVLTLKAELEDEARNLKQQLNDVSDNDFTDANLSDDQANETVSGQMNTVKLLKYDFGLREDDQGNMKKVDGGTFEGFFKADVDVDLMNENHRGGETRAGIPKNDPEFGKRNIAMYKIDQLLGANVVPPTFAAMHNGSAGIVMEKVQGVTGAKAHKDGDIDMDDPLIRQGLSKIYLLDVICAQVDRHAGNYMVVLENGVIKGVKAIDNDLAFGKNYDYDLNEQSSRFNKAYGPVLGKMPSELNEIDRTFAQKIIALNGTPQLVRDALNGLVTDEEIDATLTRLGKLADFLTPLMNQQDGPIVTQWN